MFDISVLMPYYNSESYLDRLFKSLLSQKVDNVQLIFVDDGSDDSSFAKVESYKEILNPTWQLINIHNEHDCQASAISTGLKLIDSEIFTWIDSDDELLDGFLSARIDFFKANKDYGMVRNNILEDNTLLGTDNKLLFEGDMAREVDDLFLGLFCGKYPTAGAGIYTIKTKNFFDIYTDKVIPVSKVGQNLQLILPPTSTEKCGYIDKTLYKYIRKPQSHSNSKRSIKEIIDRINDISQLLYELIPYCNYDSEKLKEYVKSYKETETSNYLKKAALANIKKIKS